MYNTLPRLCLIRYEMFIYIKGQDRLLFLQNEKKSNTLVLILAHIALPQQLPGHRPSQREKLCDDDATELDKRQKRLCTHRIMDL